MTRCLCCWAVTILHLHAESLVWIFLLRAENSSPFPWLLPHKSYMEAQSAVLMVIQAGCGYIRLSMYYRTVLEWQGSKFHFCGDSCMKPTMWWEVCWNLLQHALQCLDFLGCVSERLHEDYKTKYSDTLQPSFKGCSSPLQWFSEAVWWRTADGFYSSPAKHSGTSPNTRKSRWKIQLKSQDVNICTSVTRKKVKSQPAYLGDVLLG